MTLTLIIALFVIGLILIGVELLVTPGFVIGLIGMGFLAAGIYFIYGEYGDTAGTTSLVVVCIAVGTFFVVSLRSGFWTRIASKGEISGKANSMDQIELNTGDVGKALSALRPSGSALFTQGRFEVQTDGAFIDSGKEVIVTNTGGNKIFVKQHNT